MDRVAVGAWIAERPRQRRERRRGWLGRDRIEPRDAMLLERCRSVHTFGMRVPITVAFLDRSWCVIRVVRARPGRMLFCRRARRVLECHIGADVRIGDVLNRQGAPVGPAIQDGPDIARSART
ncbi:MAG: DUF192 domain-containing protein [Actinomycetota bacterium]